MSVTSLILTKRQQLNGKNLTRSTARNAQVYGNYKGSLKNRYNKTLGLVECMKINASEYPVTLLGIGLDQTGEVILHYSHNTQKKQ